MRHSVCLVCILMSPTFSRVNSLLKMGKYFQRINAFAIRARGIDGRALKWRNIVMTRAT